MRITVEIEIVADLIHEPSERTNGWVCSSKNIWRQILRKAERNNHEPCLLLFSVCSMILQVLALDHTCKICRGSSADDILISVFGSSVLYDHCGAVL
jgi:hypothetical protein